MCLIWKAWVWTGITSQIRKLRTVLHHSKVVVVPWISLVLLSPCVPGESTARFSAQCSQSRNSCNSWVWPAVFQNMRWALKSNWAWSTVQPRMIALASCSLWPWNRFILGESTWHRADASVPIMVMASSINDVTGKTAEVPEIIGPWARERISVKTVVKSRWKNGTNSLFEWSLPS